MIQNAFRMSWSLAILWCCTMVWGQCEADHNVIVTNFEFTPSSLTVVPGETVAFINIEGLHGVNGDSSTVTGASLAIRKCSRWTKRRAPSRARVWAW